MSNDKEQNIVYIFTNPTMPDLIKVGITSDVRQRIKDLSQPSGIPVSFKCYYACEVDDALWVEKKIHHAFAGNRINSKREFFRILPEHVKSALEIGAKKDVTPTDSVPENKEEAFALEKADEIDSKREENFTFTMLNIPIGATLHWKDDETITAKVLSNRNKIEYDGKESTISGAGKKITQKLSAGKKTYSRIASQWLYEGEALLDRRLRLETEDE